MLPYDKLIALAAGPKYTKKQLHKAKLELHQKALKDCPPGHPDRAYHRAAIKQLKSERPTKASEVDAATNVVVANVEKMHTEIKEHLKGIGTHGKSVTTWVHKARKTKKFDTPAHVMIHTTDRRDHKRIGEHLAKKGYRVQQTHDFIGGQGLRVTHKTHASAVEASKLTFHRVLKKHGYVKDPDVNNRYKHPKGHSVSVSLTPKGHESVDSIAYHSKKGATFAQRTVHSSPGQLDKHLQKIHKTQASEIVEANDKVSPHHTVFTHLGLNHVYTKPREDGGHSHKYTTGNPKAKPAVHKHLVDQGYSHTKHDATWDTYKKPGHMINMVGHPNGGFGVQHHEIHKVKATVEAAARSEHHDALESMGIKHKYSTKMANGTNEHEFSGHHDHFKQLHKHLKGQGYKHTKLGIKAKFGMFKKDNHKVIYDHKKDSVLRVVHTHS